MIAISKLNAAPQVTRSTTYERSQHVAVKQEVRRQAGSETDITTKTTTNENREITEIKRQLENQAKLSENKAVSVKENREITSLAGSNRYVNSLANTTSNKKGNLFNAIV